LSPSQERNERKRKGSGTPTDAVFHVPYASGARGAPRKGWLAPTLRYRARSPVGVPPRFLRQRPNATAQLQFTRFLRRNSLGTGVTRSLPSQCSRFPRGPVVMPAGRFGPEPPGSGGDEAPPAGTVPAPAARHHRTASLEGGSSALCNRIGDDCQELSLLTGHKIVNCAATPRH
jgi:hypothetical protein